MGNLELLHFLRPLWLLALPLTGLLWWLARRAEAESQRATGAFPDHLRAALTMNQGRRRGARPVDVVVLAVALMALAAAGPSWRKQPSPWFSETAPLVVALEVSDSMRANDLSPTRLDRARFKILDLISARTGARTGLIAYAGSAHVVMPPSTDAAVIKPFLESLDPLIMPTPGANAASVLPLARELLGDEAATAPVLFVTDGFTSDDVPAFAEFADDEGAPAVAALVVGTEVGGLALLPDGTPVRGPSGDRLDTSVDYGLVRQVASAGNVSVVRLQSGEGDISTLLRTIESNLAQADDPDARWVDDGWWLLWPAALLVGFWFRRGWTMQW